MSEWDVVVVGGGPAGLSAAHAAASAGARTLVLERAAHPRYKTCGGGLLGWSLRALPAGLSPPVSAVVDRASFSHNGRHLFTRSGGGRPLLSMVRRDEFDAALAKAAVTAGATLRENTPVRSLEQSPDAVAIRLADGSAVSARVVIGADGSAGITGRHVGVDYQQVDLGLEVELPVSPAVADQWRGRLLIDWGPLHGSYAWIFPKGDVLTVGVIAARGHGEATRAYLSAFLGQHGLAGIEPLHDSGHLTRCRSASSPLARGRVLVAGDAAGLLEPWTREGISHALRSGALAGRCAAAGSAAGYAEAVQRELGPGMAAGFQLLSVFERHPALCHAMLRTPPGWGIFARFCRGEVDLSAFLAHGVVRAGLRLL